MKADWDSGYIDIISKLSVSAGSTSLDLKILSKICVCIKQVQNIFFIIIFWILYNEDLYTI